MTRWLTESDAPEWCDPHTTRRATGSCPLDGLPLSRVGVVVRRYIPFMHICMFLMAMLKLPSGLGDYYNSCAPPGSVLENRGRPEREITQPAAPCPSRQQLAVRPCSMLPGHRLANPSRSDDDARRHHWALILAAAFPALAKPCLTRNSAFPSTNHGRRKRPSTDMLRATTRKPIQGRVRHRPGAGGFQVAR